MKLNFIRNNKIFFNDCYINSKKIKSKILKSTKLYRVAINIYVNMINVKEINYVDNCIVFNNNFVLKGITKKIDF